MQADFPVIDQASLAFMHKFNRVFDGDDMVASVFVRVIDDGRKRRGFAGAGRPGDDHEAFMQHRKFLENSGQGSANFVKVLERKHLAGNLPEDGCDSIFLREKVRAEPGHARDFVAEIDVARFFKDLDL